MGKTAKIVILSVVGAVLCVALVWGIAIRSMLFLPFGPYFSEESSTVAQGTKQTEFEADVQGIQSIYLDFVSEEISVVSTNDSKIRVEESSSRPLKDNEMMRCSANGGSFIATSGLHNSNWFNWTSFADVRVTLYIPAAYKNNVALHSVSGTIDAKDFSAAELKLDTTSGTINAGNIQASGNASASSVSGEITLRDVSAGSTDMHETSGTISVSGGNLGKVSAHSTSGEITLDAQQIDSVDAGSTSGSVRVSSESMPTNIKVGTVSGSVTLELPENDGFTLRTSSVSGSVSNDFATAHGVYKNGGQNNIEVGTTSGSITLIKK